jgi:MoxR-like ATPase
MTTNDAPESRQLALRNDSDVARPGTSTALESSSTNVEILEPSGTIFDTPEHTHQALNDVGYLTTTTVSTNIYLAARMNKPLLLEGPAGAGKTELALSVANAEKLRFIRFQCYEGISDKQAMGDYNRALQEMFVLLQSKNQTCTWDEIRTEIVGRSYFMSGPLLEALESPERVVLLIDELDKVDHSFEATLLEILSVWEMSVPGMGTIRATKPPFTVITSNQERFLGYPLRRRAIYLQIEHPTARVEAAIVARKTPDLPHELHCFIAGFGKALRAYPMDKSPSISEIVDLAKALGLLGRTSIRPQDKDILLPLIAKTEADRKKLLMKSNFENLVELAARHRDEMLSPACPSSEIVLHKEIIVPQTKATTARAVACKVTPNQKSGTGAPRLDAWGMRNLLRLPVWTVVVFFALSGHAQQGQSAQQEQQAQAALYAAEQQAQATLVAAAIRGPEALAAAEQGVQPVQPWLHMPYAPPAQQAQRPRPAEIVYYADAYADYYHVPREIVHAVITHESAWKPKVVSNMGAMGLMQLMPATAAYYGVTDPFDISQNIGGGVHYLADLIAKLGDWRLAIAGYYAGATYPLQRGLAYANQDVVQYVNAIQRLYTRELSVSPKPEAPPVAPAADPIQHNAPEVNQ